MHRERWDPLQDKIPGRRVGIEGELTQSCFSLFITWSNINHCTKVHLYFPCYLDTWLTIVASQRATRRGLVRPRGAPFTRAVLGICRACFWLTIVVCEHAIWRHERRPTPRQVCAQELCQASSWLVMVASECATLRGPAPDRRPSPGLCPGGWPDLALDAGRRTPGVVGPSGPRSSRAVLGAPACAPTFLTVLYLDSEKLRHNQILNKGGDGLL